MSSALVRQALEFVDPDVNSGNKKKRGTSKPVKRASGGQESKPKGKKTKSFGANKQSKPKQISEEVIENLLELSKPTVDKSVTDKIIKRAVKGKPLLEQPQKKKTEEKSILFPEESFSKFEEDLFCS